MSDLYLTDEKLARKNEKLGNLNKFKKLLIGKARKNKKDKTKKLLDELREDNGKMGR